TVALRVRDGAAPVVVDAWTALQTLRAATAGDSPQLPLSAVARITLEHLLISTNTFGGAPGAWGGAPGAWGGAPGAWGGASFPAGSYERSRSSNRIPVWLPIEPPERPEPCRGGFDRRPVVAVVDTGIGPHPW